MRKCLLYCIPLLVLNLAVQIGTARGAGAEGPIGNGQAVVKDPFTGTEFVFVKGGCYKMGDFFGDGDADEKPVHEVCVYDHYMAKYEVTQGQWQKVMNNNPSANNKCGLDCPVENVSWNEVNNYIKKLNIESGKRYRLPTEAEWEYAARSGGMEEKWAGTSDESRLGDFTWFNENSETVTHRVGTRKANDIGLYDMSGNVSEWCLDRYGEDYYNRSPRNNPMGPDTGEKRVLRGGSLEDTKSVRTTKRFCDSPDITDGGYGFRLLLPAY